MGDPIQVEAVLRAELLEPQAFVWKDKRYQVFDLGRHWQQSGQVHWLVRTEARQVYELIYGLDDGRWQMGRTPSDFQPRRPLV